VQQAAQDESVDRASQGEESQTDRDLCLRHAREGSGDLRVGWRQSIERREREIKRPLLRG